MKDYNAIFKRAVAYNGQIAVRDLDGEEIILDAVQSIDVNDLIKQLDEWDAAHPQKTYTQDFFEKHPRAQKGAYGAPLPCLMSTDTHVDCPRKLTDWRTETCSNDHREEHAKCWNRPMPDNR